MISVSSIQLFLAVLSTVALSIATTGAVLRVRYRQAGVGRVIPSITALFLILSTVGLVWHAAQVTDVRHILANRFDVTILLAVMVGAVAFHSQIRKGLRGLDTFMLPVALLIQVSAFAGISPPTLSGSIRAWFVVHQVSFIVGSALLICGGVAGGAYLFLRRVLRSKQRRSDLLWRLAPLESWERSGRWSLLLGFICFTFGGLTGICQASRSATTPRGDWMSDAFIVSCIVVWCLYAIGVGATWAIPQFRGRRSAQLAVVGGVLLVVLLLVVEKLSGVHQ
ncbi:MAG: hypothetical protein GY842_17955 [bacterium]|nr:hypothetical protein [bacterium]